MTSTLPPDPYKLLGVSKEASTSEIRSAHRKLVLKCHPDKVQDAALKAIKQDEFQKVQQAYELLSDDSRRTAYDDQVKLFELRKEMGRGNPTARSNPFEYEVKTAEPRPNSYTKSSPKVYSYPTSVPRSHEDVYAHDDPSRHYPKKSTSYEEKDRRRREDERVQESMRRKHEEDSRRKREEEERQRFHEREERKERERRAYLEKKKSREKERKRGSEEKRSRTSGAYVEEESSDDYRILREKSSRNEAERLHQEALRAEEKAEAARQAAREAARAQIKEAPLHQKWDSHRGKAEEYIQVSRRKGSTEDDSFHHPGLNRAQTFAAPASAAYRYAAPEDFSDDDSPRRSSAARAQMRRSAEAPASSSRRKSRERERRRSPTTHQSPNIVEPPSPPPITKRHPTLQTHNSAPPQILREKLPSRSKTSEYPRKEMPTSLPRSATFQAGDGSRSSPRDTKGSSRLREYTTVLSDSDSDNAPVHSSPTQRHSYSPPPPRQRVESTRYVVENGRSIPVVSRHRAELRDLNISDDYGNSRDRSESPTTRSGRPSISRNPQSSEHHRSHSTSYGFQTAPEAPRVVEARPKMPPREGGSNVSYRAGAKYVSNGFEKVNYAPRYAPEQVVYATYSDGVYGSPGSGGGRRSGAVDREREKEYYGSMRGGNGVYAQ